LDVIFCSIKLQFIQQSSFLTSTKTGLAPVYIIASGVALKDTALVITSSHCFIFNAFNARNNAAVPLATVTTSLTPRYFANFFSNFSISLPQINSDCIIIFLIFLMILFSKI